MPRIEHAQMIPPGDGPRSRPPGSRRASSRSTSEPMRPVHAGRGASGPSVRRSRGANWSPVERSSPSARMRRLSRSTRGRASRSRSPVGMSRGDRPPALSDPLRRSPSSARSGRLASIRRSRPESGPRPAHGRPACRCGGAPCRGARRACRGGRRSRHRQAGHGSDRRQGRLRALAALDHAARACELAAGVGEQAVEDARRRREGMDRLGRIVTGTRALIARTHSWMAADASGTASEAPISSCARGRQRS